MKPIVSILVIITLLAAAFFAFNNYIYEEKQSDGTEVAPPLVVKTEEVSYFEEAVGFLAEPEFPGDYPGVVMIHENRGLRPEIKKAAEELAAAGYRVLAVDLFKGKVMETQEEARAYSSEYDKTVGLANMQAATEFLRQTGSNRIASLGWCFGGAESLALSVSGTDLSATVIYYGRLTDDLEQLSQLSSPVLGIFGSTDQVVPLESVAKFEENLEYLGVDSEIHIYEGVGHAFANPSNPNFAPEPTADAWQKTLSFLAANLKPQN